MSLFPDIDREEILEEEMQAAAVDFLYRLEGTGQLTFCHSPNEGKRTPAERERLIELGLRPGQPDLEINLARNKTFFIELKTAAGWVFPAQKDRHVLLRSLGYDVRIIKSGSVSNCISELKDILRQYGVRF